jgi:lysozyme family protein
MTICETLKRLLSGVERITKNMNKNRALSIDSGTKEIAPPLPRDPMAGAAKDRLTVDRFPVLVERLRREEGGWSDHPKDNGGRTMFGVTEANYHDWLKDKGLPQEPVARLKWARAKDFYRERYWDVIKGPQLPVGVDWAVFDAAVNSGPARAAEWLQGAVGAKIDGDIGPRTILAAQEVDPVVTIKDLCAARLAFMRVARNKETGELLWPTFGKGWEARVKRGAA